MFNFVFENANFMVIILCETLFYWSFILVVTYVVILNVLKLRFLVLAKCSHNECERHFYEGLYKGTSWSRREWDLSASNKIREISCETWGWAVPTSTAVSAIVETAKLCNCTCIVDYGAGRGYWSHLISRYGASDLSVIAMDANPTWYAGGSHHPIIIGGIGVYGAKRDGPDRIDPAGELMARQYLGQSAALLLLVWPPCWSPMAADALDAFAGPALAYVGEPVGGRTASAAFFQRLAGGWDLRRRVALPNWAGCADALYVYTRRT
jgi:hypothetical protein